MDLKAKRERDPSFPVIFYARPLFFPNQKIGDSPGLLLNRYASWTDMSNYLAELAT